MSGRRLWIVTLRFDGAIPRHRRVEKAAGRVIHRLRGKTNLLGVDTVAEDRALVVQVASSQRTQWKAKVEAAHAVVPHIRALGYSTEKGELHCKAMHLPSAA